MFSFLNSVKLRFFPLPNEMQKKSFIEYLSNSMPSGRTFQQCLEKQISNKKDPRIVNSMNRMLLRKKEGEDQIEILFHEGFINKFEKLLLSGSQNMGEALPLLKKIRVVKQGASKAISKTIKQIVVSTLLTLLLFPIFEDKLKSLWASLSSISAAAGKIPTEVPILIAHPNIVFLIMACIVAIYFLVSHFVGWFYKNKTSLFYTLFQFKFYEDFFYVFTIGAALKERGISNVGIAASIAENAPNVFIAQLFSQIKTINQNQGGQFYDVFYSMRQQIPPEIIDYMQDAEDTGAYARYMQLSANLCEQKIEDNQELIKDYLTQFLLMALVLVLGLVAIFFSKDVMKLITYPLINMNT